MKRVHPHAPRIVTAFLAAALALGSMPVLAACGSDGAGSDDVTSGPAFTAPDPFATSAFDPGAAQGQNGALIDTSHLADGYVSASAHSDVRLKFQVSSGDMSYNYDLPGDGTPIVCPLNMGDGSYLFRVMRNTQGTSYVEIARASADVRMASEFEPFIRPNLFCNYSSESACVAKARELAAGAENEGDVMRSIYMWIRDNISYDDAKASELADATGYVPDPDSTLASKTGICFDYASLAAAMFRSLGIPAKIITGYVEPDSIYHAWNLVFIDGEWRSVEISVDPNTWTRIDLTFASSGALDTVGNGESYTDRYVY